jgi:hypothetical protein
VFITVPHFEQLMPESVGPNQQWWRAVTVFAASHWFLFSYEGDWDGQKVAESAMAADEWTLLSLVSRIPASDRKAICRAEKVGARWEFRWLDALWIPAAAEVEGRGVLLLQFEGENFARDCRMEPMKPAPGRRLFYRAPEASLEAPRNGAGAA